MQNQKSKNKFSPVSVLAVASTYVSFGLAYWYGARGTATTIAFAALFANEIVAVLLGGLVPFALFELAMRFYIRPLQRAGVFGLDKRILRLRLFFIVGNLVCFGASFVYFAYPFLSVWGGVLLNFVILFATLVIYLIFESKKFEDKTKIAYFVMQTGSVFLAMFGVIAIARVFLGLL